MMPNLEEATDEELMITYQQGDKTAFDILYKRHSAKVYGFLRSREKEPGLADDLFQSTFMKLHQARSSYDPRFPFLPWLFTVCRTVLIDSRRRRARAHEDLNEVAISKAAVLSEIDSSPMAAFPDLEGLDPAQQRALELRYGHDFSFEEIATRLDTTTVNARQLVSRAIRKLRSLAGKNGRDTQ